jgi:hypothetical protein
MRKAQHDMTEPSLRKIIRGWWRDATADQEQVDLKALATRGAAELAQQPDIRDRLIAELFEPLVYDIGLHVLSDQRGHIGTRTTVKGGDIADALESDGMGWSHWMEYDPTSGQHILLFAMTKEQALSAAAAREKRADPDLRRAALLRLAAGRVKKGKRLDTAWTAEALADIEAKLVIEPPKYSLGQGTIYELMKGAAD